MQSVITALGEKNVCCCQGIWFHNLVQKILNQCSDCTIVQNFFIKKCGGGSYFPAGQLWGWAKRISLHSNEGWDETCGCWVQGGGQAGGWLQLWCPCISVLKVVFGTVHLPTLLPAHFASPAEAQCVSQLQGPCNDFWTASKSCLCRV